MGLKSVVFVLRSNKNCKGIDLIFNIKRFFDLSRLNGFFVRRYSQEWNGFECKEI